MLGDTILNSPHSRNEAIIHAPTTSCYVETETTIVDTRKNIKKIEENTEIVQNRSTLSVGFTHVSIREYAVIIGDNPACSFGAPLSLDWEYTEVLKDISIDIFEKSRVGARRHGDDLIIPAQIRANFLVQRGCETSAIFQACREVQDVRRRRRETLELDKKKVRKACPPRGGYYSSVVIH